MFKPEAGMMRGFRIVRDPEGIFFDPFDFNGVQMGYVITYGEGDPAVHNGEEWVSVLTEEAQKTFQDDLQSLIVEQGTKLAGVVDNPVYAELAAQMGMFANSTAGGADPNDQTAVFGG